MRKRKRARISRKTAGLVTETSRETVVDDQVIGDANDDSAWGKPISVKRQSASMSLSRGLAERAAFLARLHQERDLESWIERVVRERVELEEKAFSRARRELAARRGS